MNNQAGAAKMRKVGERIKKEIPGLGYALFVFEFHKPGIANYISNAQRGDMIMALEEIIARLKGKKDFQTPEEN